MRAGEWGWQKGRTTAARCHVNPKKTLLRLYPQSSIRHVSFRIVSLSLSHSPSPIYSSTTIQRSLLPLRTWRFCARYTYTLDHAPFSPFSRSRLELHFPAAFLLPLEGARTREDDIGSSAGYRHCTRPPPNIHSPFASDGDKGGARIAMVRKAVFSLTEKIERGGGGGGERRKKESERHFSSMLGEFLVSYGFRKKRGAAVRDSAPRGNYVRWPRCGDALCMCLYVWAVALHSKEIGKYGVKRPTTALFPS